MKIYQQSPEVLMIQQQKIIAQVRSKRRKYQSNKPLLNDPIFQNLNQLRNMTIGAIGEGTIGAILQSLPDSWIMFNNVLLPTREGKSTEIDLLLIGNTGVYLIEIKTWKGSFAAYKDKWKKRDGEQWVPLEKSPTEQSLYHQRIFSQWINSKIPNIPKQSITAPVIFLAAKWIGAKECSVPVFHKLDDFFKVLTQSSQILSEELIENIAQSLVKININDFAPAQVVKYQTAQIKELFRGL